MGGNQPDPEIHPRDADNPWALLRMRPVSDRTLFELEYRLTDIDTKLTKLIEMQERREVLADFERLTAAFDQRVRR